MQEQMGMSTFQSPFLIQLIILLLLVYKILLLGQYVGETGPKTEKKINGDLFFLKH